MIPLKGIQKTTLIDFAPNIASTLFLGGCNFRCSFCHNSDLIDASVGADITENELFEFLKRRQKFLDGVCITGGEPTIHQELPAWIKKIQEFGLKIKLDTNGTNPTMLSNLIKEKLIDYVAMDVKAPIDSYEDVVLVSVDKEAIEESKNLLITDDVDYEFRTTVVPGIHGEDELIQMAKWIEGAKKYYLQPYRPNENVLDVSLRDTSPTPIAWLEAMASKLSSIVPTAVR
jgi:pyruvate formate lyase activating enzyme